jgi:hypothetical protein
VSEGPARRGQTETLVDAAPAPAEFTARNLMLTVAKFVNPVMVIGEVVPTASVQEPAPTLYWYFVIAAPPSAPAANAIEAEPTPAVATNEVGAAGAVGGSTNELVMTRFVPLPDTATNLPFPYATEIQLFASAALRSVQVAPSVEDIT